MEFSKNAFGDFYSYTGVDGDFIQERIKAYGHFEEGISLWILKNVQPGWIVYDIGANVFEYTELSARVAKKQGMVYAFEPQKDLVKAYERSQELNDYTDVAAIKVFPFGLSDVNDTVKFYKNESSVGGSSIDKDFVEYSHRQCGAEFVETTIEVKRADSIYLPEVIPDLIKIDIEGAEESFWRGAPNFLKKARHIIAEIGPYTSEWILSEYMIDRKAYDLSDVLFANNVTELVNNMSEFMKKDHQMNIVFK